MLMSFEIVGGGTKAIRVVGELADSGIAKLAKRSSHNLRLVTVIENDPRSTITIGSGFGPAYRTRLRDEGVVLLDRQPKVALNAPRQVTPCGTF